MEEIIKKLEEIVNQELDKKVIPNENVLESIRAIMSYRFEKNLNAFIESSKINSQTENKAG